MEPVKSNYSEFQQKILASTTLDQDTVRIVGEYSDEDVEKLTSIISKETLEKIFDPPKEMKKEGLVGRLIDQNVKKDKFILALDKLMSDANIKRKEEFQQKYYVFKNPKSWALEMLSERPEEDKTKKRFLSESILLLISSSQYIVTISEQLVLHLLESARQSSSEKERQETLEELGRLSKLSKKDPQMKDFIENVLDILEFKSQINNDIETTKVISKESIDLIKKVLFKNPDFASLLIYLIPQDHRTDCMMTLLNADFSGSRVDQYSIKAKLLATALEFNTALRMDLPNDFLDKVSLETRIKPSAFINEVDQINTFGDVLFYIDLGIYKLLSNKATHENVYRDVYGIPSRNKMDEIKNELLKEMVYLKGKNFRIPAELTDGYPASSIIKDLKEKMQDLEKKGDKGDIKKDEK